jgi:hypothetical protein
MEMITDPRASDILVNRGGIVGKKTAPSCGVVDARLDP